MQTYKQQVEELRIKLLNQVENTFEQHKEDGIVIEFNNPFIVFQEVEVYNHEYVKERFIVEQLENGMTLLGKDYNGDEWEENIYQLEALEAAHLLDLITDGHYKLLTT